MLREAMAAFVTTGIGGYGSPLSRGRQERSLLRSSRALDEGLAALHLVGQRRLVDLDHDVVGVDAEVLHQRLGDVAHHADLLFLGAAGRHADGDFGHFVTPLLLLQLSLPRHEAQEPHLALWSSSAKADDPVFRAGSFRTLPSRRTGCPLSRA